MPAKKVAAAAAPATRELPMAPHLSTPLELPWLTAYAGTLQQISTKLGSALAGYAAPPKPAAQS